jgi:NADPH-ferrihemoprotein reductase
VFVRASSFRLPQNIARPLLLVGPGTGIAPMRAFLQERRHLLASNPSLRAQAGPIALFFGCRYAEVDCIYKDELRVLLQEGVLSHLFLAFSRDPQVAEGQWTAAAGCTMQARCKVYVQDILQEPAVAQQMLKWLQGQEGHVYVCGATNMGHDVMGALQKVLQGSIEGVDAHEAIKALQESNRYIQELWTA